MYFVASTSKYCIDWLPRPSIARLGRCAPAQHSTLTSARPYVLKYPEQTSALATAQLCVLALARPSALQHRPVRSSTVQCAPAQTSGLQHRPVHSSTDQCAPARCTYNPGAHSFRVRYLFFRSPCFRLPSTRSFASDRGMLALLPSGPAGF